MYPFRLGILTPNWVIGDERKGRGILRRTNDSGKIIDWIFNGIMMGMALGRFVG